MSETLGSLHTGVHEPPEAVKELATTDHPSHVLQLYFVLIFLLPLPWIYREFPLAIGTHFP